MRKILAIKALDAGKQAENLNIKSQSDDDVYEQWYKLT